MRMKDSAITIQPSNFFATALAILYATNKNICMVMYKSLPTSYSIQENMVTAHTEVTKHACTLLSQEHTDVLAIY